MKIEKILKSGLLIIVAGFIFATMSAQSRKQPLTYSGTEEIIMVGDTVMISKNCLNYETSERIVKWAFKKKHTVRQVNSKHHPNAILLKRIYSWIPAEAAVFVSRGSLKRTESEEAKARNINKYSGVLSPSHSTYGETVAMEISNASAKSSSAQSFSKSSMIASAGEGLNGEMLAGGSFVLDTVAEPLAPMGQARMLYKISVYRLNTMTQDKQLIDVQVKDSICNDCKEVIEYNDSVNDVINRQYDRFTIGVRGSFASTMALPSNTFFMPIGYSARLDLQYAHYWPTKNRKGHLGLLTGLSAGYMNVNRYQKWDEIYETYDEYGAMLKYHMTADDIYENTQELQVEVPLMASWIGAKGFYFNIGPRFLLPLYTQYTQTIHNGNVTVKDEAKGSIMYNSSVYGALSDQPVKYNATNKYSWSLLLGFEIGGEIRFKSGHTMGIGAYANWGVYNADYGVYDFKGNATKSSPLTVTIPTTATGKGHIAVKPLSESYTSIMGHLEVGLKLNFNLNFMK